MVSLLLPEPDQREGRKTRAPRLAGCCCQLARGGDAGNGDKDGVTVVVSLGLTAETLR